MIYTGPIDEFFDFASASLPYRSLRFEHVTLDMRAFQPVAVVNYPQTEDYTRDHRIQAPDRTASIRKTSLTYEYPTRRRRPLLPVPRAENEALYKRYEALALAMPDVWFVGRLATYRYYNMDQVVGQALATFARDPEEPPAPIAACRVRAGRRPE